MASQESFIVEGTEDIIIFTYSRPVLLPVVERIPKDNSDARIFYDTYQSQIEPQGLDLSCMVDAGF